MGGAYRRISPADRNHMGMGAVDSSEEDMLLILYIISIAHFTGRGGILGPGHCFNS